MGQDSSRTEELEEALRIAGLLVPYIADLCLERRQSPFVLAERTRTELILGLCSGRPN